MVTKKEFQLVLAQLIEQVGVLLKFTADLDKRIKALETPTTPAADESQ